MLEQDALVAIYTRHAESEHAVRAFRVTGFDMAKVSVVAKDHEPHRCVTGLRDGDRRAPFLRSEQPFWAGLWPLLHWAAFLWIPGTGSLLVGGPLLAAIAGTPDRGDIAPRLSAVGVGLYRLGIPTHTIVRCDTAIKNHQDLVIAQGAEEAMALARRIFRASGAVHVSSHRGQAQMQSVSA